MSPDNRRDASGEDTLMCCLECGSPILESRLLKISRPDVAWGHGLLTEYRFEKLLFFPGEVDRGSAVDDQFSVEVIQFMLYHTGQVSRIALVDFFPIPVIGLHLDRGGAAYVDTDVRA